ncbi:unnamed protein product, partial [Urochloa humidicola]
SPLFPRPLLFHPRDLLPKGGDEATLASSDHGGAGEGSGGLHARPICAADGQGFRCLTPPACRRGGEATLTAGGSSAPHPSLVARWRAVVVA